jgi:hypothetical protein
MRGFQHSHLRQTFSTFLGANPNVRVEYRSTRTNDKVVGWVSKTKTAAFTISTIITNKSPHVLCVGVLETIPRSYTDKVKVRVRAWVTHVSFKYCDS